MPRAKSDDAKTSTELDAEIKEMLEKVAAKKKAARLAKQREDREAEQARKYEEAQFNREFVEATKTIRLSDYEDDGRTIYELIRAIIRPPVAPGPEPDDIPGGNEEL